MKQYGHIGYDGMGDRNKRSLIVEKPWGSFRQFVLNRECTVKIHTIKKGEACSLQSHSRRSELFVPLDEGIVIELDGEKISPMPGDEIYVPLGARHRFSSTIKDARMLEIGFGEFDENDITRHEDRYGRL